MDFENVRLLEFKGPDAVRFLNGQLTQDVRKVVGTGLALPSCVTDAKGRLQFRVYLTEAPDGALWIYSSDATEGDLEARLTRYLIADDVEVRDLSGTMRLVHLIDADVAGDDVAFARDCRRFATDGKDCWISSAELKEPAVIQKDVLENLRIANGVPFWGAELVEGLLPPEAGLDATDISYAKGCYIGQEVISRIKSAGKVNKRLMKLELEAQVPAKPGDGIFVEGAEVGKLTSVSPLDDGGVRRALGYVKRTADLEVLDVVPENGLAHRIKVV